MHKKGKAAPVPPIRMAPARRAAILAGLIFAAGLTGCALPGAGPSAAPASREPSPPGITPLHTPVSEIASMEGTGESGFTGAAEEGTATEVSAGFSGRDPLDGLTASVLNHTPLKGPSVPILMYHSISHNPANSLCTDPGDFAREMDWLAAEGYTPVTLADLLKAWAGRETLPAKSVVITFDDGYKDNILAAYPVLKQRGFRATIFVITHYVDKPNYVSWEDLAMAENTGVFDVESHTVDHLDLTALPPGQLTRELRDSKADIEARLHKTVYALCYPSGRFNPAVERAAEQAGYLLAVTTRPGAASPDQGRYSLHRVRISGGESLLAFESQLDGSAAQALAVAERPGHSGGKR
ncbi:MAG: polysaccharide deacetylase family protein [Kyrpidia sp.]|nr:polysaccharide deacetylase family protein [Kyrpidia sp.]